MTPPGRPLRAPLAVQDFARDRATGGVLLLAASVAALVWANSPAAAHYERFRELPFSLRAGGFLLERPLVEWVNEGLMGIFFFVVGLEIKREGLVGELASLRQAVLPAVAALGGMVVPAGLYAALNHGGPAAAGWGIPMATDIAFALAVVSLLGRASPPGLLVFLTALAIADDIGAILVIALFFSGDLALASLAAGAACLGLAVLLNALQVRHPLVYLGVGLLAWLAFLGSGVHATLAAVGMAFAIPARSRFDHEEFVARMQDGIERFKGAAGARGLGFLSEEQHGVLQEMDDLVDQRVAPVQTLEHHLMPLVTFLVLPAFALANAGVRLEAAAWRGLVEPVGLGILLGLCVGKQAGILGFSWIAVKLGLARLPAGIRWGHVHGAGLLAGIGFTLSLFFASLAFDEPEVERTAKLSILLASLASGSAGFLVLRGLGRKKGDQSSSARSAGRTPRR